MKSYKFFEKFNFKNSELLFEKYYYFDIILLAFSVIAIVSQNHLLALGLFICIVIMLKINLIYLEKTKNSLTESKQRLSTLMQVAPVGIFQTDANGHCVYMNDTLLQLSGITLQEALGRGWEDTIHPEDREKITSLWYDSVRNNADYSAEMRLLSKTNQPHWVYCQSVALKDSDHRVTGYMGAVLDISARKTLETQLISASEKAIAQSKLKSAFLANISHEIRTPLNGIIGITGLLHNTKLNQEQLEYVETIRSSSDILLFLINDILDFSKIESNRLELEKIHFDLFQLIKETNDNFIPLLNEKQLLFITEFSSENLTNYRLQGDPGRIKQVLSNLLSNAIKFTTKGNITLRVKQQEQINGKIKFRFELSDTGIGISKHILPKLFRPFTQADCSTTRKYGGTGLGLSICKGLVELMGGTIGAESTLGSGSTFWFTVWLTTSPAEIVKSKTPLAMNLKKIEKNLRVLVVDDNCINQKVAAKILEKIGCTVLYANNGIEAIQTLGKLPCDMIFMDCQMPELDGYETTRQIRKSPDEKIRNIPIIAMTANAIYGDQEKCLAAGMNDYVAKPIRLENMKSTISKWEAYCNGN